MPSRGQAARPTGPALAMAGFVTALLLAACTASDSPGRGPETWVTVTGPIDWIAPAEMALEIGDTAWSITPDGGGGLAMATLDQPADVLLVGIEDCREYARFTAEPGSAHVIRFQRDGSVEVEDWTGREIEMGPALSQSAPGGC